MNKDFVHAKNEHLYCLVRKDTIANQIYHVIVGEKKKNLVQFYVWFHMLIKGRSMTYDYESMNKVLHFFDVENFPKTHWSNIVGWEMVACNHDLVVNKTKSLVEDAKFMFLSCDLKSQLVIISSLRFQFMLMRWKIGNEHLCCYPHNMWLMGPFFII